jgi:hypothetical protein
MLWDLYQHYQIDQLESKLTRVENQTTEDGAARRAAAHLEERVDRLVLLCRALFELHQESTGHAEERLSAKILEIDMRDGLADGRMSPIPERCPKCEAMMSPRFGRCLFCGYISPSGPAL